MSCFKSSTKSTLPSYINAGQQAVAGKATSVLNKPFVPYNQPMVAGVNQTQIDANKGLTDLAAGPNLPRVIDDIPGGLPGGKAGSTQDYMDPYLEEVLGPILRKLGIANKENLMGVDAKANMAGAFGDTGHALERAETGERGVQTVADATGKVYSDAYNNAMGLKQADINRIGADKSQKAQMYSTIFGQGTTSQETDQKALNADFAEFLRQQGWDADQLAKVASIIGSMQAGGTTTTPSTASSILGAGAGILSLF